MTIFSNKAVKACTIASIAMLLPNLAAAEHSDSKHTDTTHHQKSKHHKHHAKKSHRKHKSHAKHTATKKSGSSMYIGATGNGSMILTQDTEWTTLVVPSKNWLNGTAYKALNSSIASAAADVGAVPQPVTVSDMKLTSKRGMGFGGGIMMGMQFGKSMALELEGAMDMTSKIKTSDDVADVPKGYGKYIGTKYDTTPFTPSPTSGTLGRDQDKPAAITDKDYVKYTAFYGLVSGMFNIDFGSKIMPYIQVGGGGGYVQADFTDAGTSFAKNPVLSSGTGTTNGIGIIDSAGLASVTSKAGGTSLGNVIGSEPKFEKKFTFMMKAGAGISLKASDKLSISVGYAFIGSPSTIEFKGKDVDTNLMKTKMQRHAVNVGLRVAF